MLWAQVQWIFSVKKNDVKPSLKTMFEVILLERAPGYRRVFDFHSRDRSSCEISLCYITHMFHTSSYIRNGDETFRSMEIVHIS